MTVLFYIFLIAAFFRGGYCAAISALTLAIYLLAPTLDVEQYVLFSAILISIPLSAYIAGLLLDRFVIKEKTEYRGIFSGLLFCASMFLALNSNQFMAYLDAALRVTLSATETMVLILSSINSSLLAGSVLALFVILILLISEIPFKFLKIARNSYATLSFSAIRPILTCFVLALMLRFTTNYLGNVLSPDNIEANAHSLNMKGESNKNDLGELAEDRNMLSNQDIADPHSTSGDLSQQETMVK